ncbi:nucleoside-diphosphate-sugar pyrophosphorylase [Halomicronema hongdechloris C2206]|uniref:UDP-3-O-acylglucosamine N-acyltransferase n=1 Tax=Halomicronema hongdechloris C2206 TaxID=1641165 RepID=A0A1Z3HPV3_9CYAN|nr:UDP-3-O-(3-hydroxymyristoyl)glucosamine N-acyltransferase [Halomicronema hongdechloris]ASC72197.1 nucleoside-diphosphate-sugar pyrophosphorylase [Halomicronema hongdechloris C2206]
MKFSALAQHLGPVEATSLAQPPQQDPEITGVMAVDSATAGTLSYIEGDKFAAQIEQTAASALILPTDETLQGRARARGIAWVSCRDPRLAFARAIAQFYRPFRPQPGIHPTAVIDASVTYGKNLSVGAHAVIQAGVTLGDDVCIHPNVVIYPGASIGDHTVLHASCVIHERSQIGRDCVIHCGAVIGSEGFGFVATAQGWEKMEQSGRTVLEDGVEVGCNAAIDRPAVGETRIGRNTKIDNLVQVGHGCQVGEAVAMAAQVGLGGSSRIGHRVLLGGQAGVANQSRVGDGAIATAQTGVNGHVDPGQVVSGTPAVPHKIYLKVSAIYSRLPEMYRLFRRLQRHSS